MHTIVSVMYATQGHSFSRWGEPLTDKRFKSVAELRLFHNEPINDEEAAEYAFRLMNAVDGREPVCKLEVRSMCAGDLVSVQTGDERTSRQLVCRNTGFEDVTGQVSTEQIKQERVTSFPVIANPRGALVY